MRTHIRSLSLSVATAIVIFPFCALASEGTSESRSIPKIRRTDEGGLKPHVGLMAGYLGETGNASNQDGSAAVEAGVQALPALETTVQFQYTPGSITAPRSKANYNVTDLLLKVAYNFGGDIPLLRDSYVGAKSGAAMSTLEGETTTRFAVGGTLGFDIPLGISSNVSLGAEGAYLAVIGDNTQDEVSALGAMKYWF